MPPWNASLMTAYDEKLKHVVNTADGVRDIARGTAIDGALLAEKMVDDKLNKAAIDITSVVAQLRDWLQDH